MNQTFLTQIAFQSSDSPEVNFEILKLKTVSNFKSRGTEKFELSSQGTYSFQILGNEALIIADYEY